MMSTGPVAYPFASHRRKVTGRHKAMTVTIDFAEKIAIGNQCQVIIRSSYRKGSNLFSLLASCWNPGKISEMLHGSGYGL